jgi:hypothetical protein
LRRFLSFLGVAAAIPVFLAVPVLARPAVAPHPVVPHVADVQVAALPNVRGVVADTGHKATARFSLVGASWHTGTLSPVSTIEVRTRSAGKWSAWSALSLPDGGPDDGSSDAKAAAARHLSATEPLWVGPADGVEARVVDAAGKAAAAPRDLRLVLVDGGSSKADASPGPARTLGGSVAEAAQSQPTIYTRAQWGADERLRTSVCPKGPDYSSTIKMGFVHHTDGTNAYTASQVPSIIRSIYAYHVQSNGWCDVGYNFLVDRFGRIWEGRYGGIDKAVIGAHTGGFNTNSFGTSLIGTFSSTTPPAAMLTALERLYAWKLGMYFRDPTGRTTMVAGSFSGSRYAKGTTVTFNVISGHRDADTTTCPGSAAYAKLGAIRSGVRSLIGAGFVSPTVAPSTVRMLSGQTVAIHAGVLSDQSWTATVTDSAGLTVKTLTGDPVTPAGGLAASWDGTGVDGTPVPPGTYTVTLTGSDANGSADVPYSTHVTVTPPVTITGPPAATYGAKVVLTGTSAPASTVTVTLQAATPGAPADVRDVTAAADGTWSTSFTANDDYSWSASSQGWTTPSTPATKTMVTPDVTTPALASSRTVFVAKGATLTLSGTGMPKTTVQAVTTPAGGAASSGPSVTVGADGTWTGITLTPAVTSTVSLQRSSSAASLPFTVYPVPAPTATAPAAGYAQRSFAVTGNAGAPVTVQLWTQPAGAPSYTLVKTVTAAASGAFALATVLPSAAPSAVAWKVVTTDGSTTFGTTRGSVSVRPLFAPTSTGPAGGAYRHVVRVSGAAVPGDVVTVWTRAATGGRWSRAASVTSDASTGAFTARFTLLRDTVWRVTSPTGSSTARTVVVRPTLAGPTRAKRGAMVYLSGWALPRQKVALYRRPLGTSAGRYYGAVTAGAAGRWYAHFRLTHQLQVIAASHGHWSRILTIRYA